MSDDDEVSELGAALTAASEVGDLWVAPVEGGYVQQRIFRDMGHGTNDSAGRQRP